MRIVQINCVYKTGSTGKIVFELHKYYQTLGNKSYVLYGRGKRKREKNVFKVSTEIGAHIHHIKSLLFSKDFSYSFFETLYTILLLKQIKPDVVHIHCINGHCINAYKLIKYLKKQQIRTILTLHAEIMHTAGCEHAMECDKWVEGCFECDKVCGRISRYFRDDSRLCYKLMHNAFQDFKELTVVGCSEWIMNRAKQSLVFRDAGCDFSFIHNDIDYEAFQYRNPKLLVEKMGLQGKKIVLNVTSNFSYYIKGPEYFIEIAKRLPDYQFIVVGFNGWKEELPSNIITIEKTENKYQLAEYYSMADCFISTSIRETLPTVCIEASSCGCNVIAFDSGGAKETINIGQGDTVTPYDIEEFVKKIQYWVEIPHIKNQKNKTSSMGEKYLELYSRPIA